MLILVQSLLINDYAFGINMFKLPWYIYIKYYIKKIKVVKESNFHFKNISFKKNIKPFLIKKNNKYIPTKI